VDQQTPDIKSVVQEIVKREDWGSGNALAILISGDTASKSNARIAESHDGVPASAPVLHVQYYEETSTPSTTTTTTVQPTTTTSTTSTTVSPSTTTTERPVTTTTAPSTTTTTIPPTPTTLSIPVAARSDDAEEYLVDGRVDAGSSDLEMSFEKEGQIVGIRFANVTIPQEATVSSAYIQFTVDERGSGATVLTIRGEDVGNAATFVETNFDVSNRLNFRPTSAAATWSPADWNNVGEAGANQRTGDIKSVIQEIINRSDWASGNALVILVTGDTTSKSNSRIAESYDGVPVSAPVLHVEYLP
jgi:hypothetical protein